MKIFDGIQSLYNGLINRRSAQNTNIVTSTRIDYSELRSIYKTGLGSKIVRIKSGYALKDTLQFESEDEQIFYDKHFARAVKKASQYAIGFGRGIIVLYNKGDDLSLPARDKFTFPRARMKVFSGDLVTVTSPVLDFMSDRYYKPDMYMVRGYSVHPSRVIDFTYFDPPELDAPKYQYGGVSEFELIHNQLINDGIVERASASILERNSTLFYKIAGFKQNLMNKQEGPMLEYFNALENGRSIYGAGLIDADDTVESVTQALTNLSEADMITLRRLAMVTGIPLAWLVGENVKGLNATGDNERQIFREMLEALQQDYLIEPINELLGMFGLPPAWFKDNQGGTALERIEYETKAIANAQILWQMGEDHTKYLEDKDVIKPDKFADFFADEDDQEPEPMMQLPPLEMFPDEA